MAREDKDTGSNSNKNVLKSIFGGGAEKKRLSKEVDSNKSSSFSPFAQTRKQVKIRVLISKFKRAMERMIKFNR